MRFPAQVGSAAWDAFNPSRGRRKAISHFSSLAPRFLAERRFGAARGKNKSPSTIARAIYRTLDFPNLLEDDRPRLSLTKIGLCGAKLTNLANGIAHVGDRIRALLTDAPRYLSLPLLAATPITHAIAAAKAELKRKSTTGLRKSKRDRQDRALL
jgi:hypothetical protein